MNTPTPQEDWQPCPAGKVQGLVNRLQQQRRAEKTQKGLAVVSVVLLCLFVGSYSLTILKEPSFGGIVCSEVKEHAMAFMDNTLDQVTAGKIRLHLSKCEHCRESFAEMGMELPPAADDHARQTTTRHNLSHFAVARLTTP